MQISYNYEHVPTLREFARSDAVIRAILGPFASGKSSACVAEIVRRAHMQPESPDGIRHSRWAIIRNTYSELRTTTLQTVFQWLPPAYFGKYVENKHIFGVRAFEGIDLELLFLALDRPDDVSKLLSLELTGAWVNESREVPWSIVEALQGRVGRYPPRRDVKEYWSGIIMDTNPPDTDSSFYKHFEERAWLKDFEKLKREGGFPADMEPEEYSVIFKQPSGLSKDAENLVNLKPGYYQQLAIGKSEEWKKVYVDGDYGFVMEGKLVYPEYGDRVHCLEVDPIEGITIVRSFDYGLTPACVFSQMLPDGRWLVFDEMTSDNMSIDEFSDEVLNHCNRVFRGTVRFEDWGDPAGDQRAQTDKRTCFEIMRGKGFDVQPSIQDPTLRQESVRKVLRTLVNGEPQFIIHPRCRMLRKGFMGGYHRRRMNTPGPERYTSEPQKNAYSHCFPAGTMIATPTGERPIESLRVGDTVTTPLGPRDVQATMDRMVDQLVEIETAAGRKVQCTPDHPIWNDGGFIRADALRYGDLLGVTESWGGQRSIRSRNSTASGTIGSRQGTIAPTRATTCIAMCGAIITALSRRESRFTTSMRTRPTTISTISRRALAACTSGTTAISERSTIPSGPPSTWPEFVRRRALGIDPRKVAPGIASTLARWLRASLTRSIAAFNARGTISFAGVRGNAVIARPLASQLLAGRAASTTRCAGASSARHSSRSAAMLRPPHGDVVAAVSSVNRTHVRVYDLTIEGAHCFYANGMLVGNCHDALQYAMVQYFGGALIHDAPVEDDWPRSSSAVDVMPRSSSTGY